MRPAALVLFAALTACTPGSDGSDAGTADLLVPPDLAVDKAAACTGTFGNALTASFGRLDGTLLAVVPPNHPTCPLPNNDHLILEITANGAVYRMVVNVLSDRAIADPRVAWAALDHALPGAPFAEGWHPTETLDYMVTLGVHADAFTPEDMAPLVARITDAVTLGAPISVYATSSGGASAHLVHRNAAGQDGAIVIDPTGAPRLLLFRFSTQTF